MYIKKLIVIAISGALLGCGGGGSSSSATTAGTGQPASTLLSGTAAGGAAIIGTVTIKDSLGRQVTGPIVAGHYNIDVAGLTGPFLLRASGTVGGSNVAYVSAATADDLGKTINITPFTDLIVANIAGKAAAAYFDQPDYTRLSAREIKSATDTLAARIGPILADLGVEAGFDLLRTAFAADHTKFDAVMDMVHVSVDASTNKALITNVIDGQHIEDDLASKADTTALPKAPDGSLTTAASDLAAIEQVLTKYSALFATSIPAANNTQLLSLIADDFLNDGLDKARFLSPDSELTADMIGFKLSSPTILRKVSDSVLWVRFNYAEGGTSGSSGTAKMQFRKNASGVWQMAGNRQHADITIHSVNSRYIDGASTYFSRNLEVWIDSSADTIQYARLTGPGLDTAGVELVRSTDAAATNFNVSGLPYSGSFVPDCVDRNNQQPCIDFTQMGSNAQYTITYLDAARTPQATDTVMVPTAPVSNDEARANVATRFASFDSSRFLPASYAGLANGGSISVSWTNPTDSSHVTHHLGFQVGDTSFHNDLKRTDTTKVLGSWSSGTPGSAGQVWIFTADSQARRYVTTQVY